MDSTIRPLHIVNQYDYTYPDYTKDGYPRKALFPDPALPYNDIKYMVLEEWEFDPFTFLTNVRIVGIAVVYSALDKYKNDRSGTCIEWVDEELGKEFLIEYTQELFWVKWEDARSMFTGYMQKHHGRNIQQYWWDSFIAAMGPSDTTCNEKTSTSNLWRRSTLNDLEVHKNETRHYPKQGATVIYKDYSTLGQIIHNSIQNHLLTPYNADQPDKIAPIDYPAAPKEKIDTIYVENIDHARITIRGNNWNEFPYFTIATQWLFDPMDGRTFQKITGLEPRFDRYRFIYSKDTLQSIETKNLILLHFEDVKSTLRDYDDIHPVDNFSTALWLSYFQQEPFVVK